MENTNLPSDYLPHTLKERKEYFEQIWWGCFEDAGCKVYLRENDSYTIESSKGTYDLYLKRNRGLYRKENRWFSNALALLIRDILGPQYLKQML